MLCDRLRTTAKRFYTWLESVWFASLVYEGAPLVRLLDMTVGSDCKYCMACRAAMLGAGLAMWNGFGVCLILSAVALTALEYTATKEK